MQTQLPTNAHDLALWLYDNLDGISPVQGMVVEGRLPDAYDFDRVHAHIEQVAERISGLINKAERKIEFDPSAAGVYTSLAQLLAVAANRKQVPVKFTIISPRYTHPATTGIETPTEVCHYVDATRLWSVVSKLADISDSNSALFVASQNSLLEVRPDYSAQSLAGLPSLPEVASEFANSTIHIDQKRSIFRSSLVEHFKPRSQISLADLILKFEEIATDIKRSYAMYMADFSYHKVRSEIEKENLEDALRLNKTLADIQNQLLALPAAILLAGATITAGPSIRNFAVMAGLWIFCIFIVLLVRNQRHSIDAISNEIELRKKKINKLSENEKNDLLTLFNSLDSRAKSQRLTLRLINVVVFTIAILTTLSVMTIAYGISPDDLINKFRNFFAIR